MSEPEISRRCLTCGATVRHSAAFCPQCGQMLDSRETPIDPPPADESAPTVLELRTPETVIERREEDLEENPPPQNFETRPLSSTQAAPMLETQPLHVVSPNATANELPPPIVTRVDDSARRKHEPSVLERVEKLRKASSGMIDQAAYDPSLRFLLVTAVLVILFVILMILSKVVG